MARVKTVTIDRDGMPVKINAESFNPAIHSLFGEKPKEDDYSEQDNLIAQLKEFGIKRDRRTDVDKLRELVAEQIAKANEAIREAE